MASRLKRSFCDSLEINPNMRFFLLFSGALSEMKEFLTVEKNETFIVLFMSDVS